MKINVNTKMEVSKVIAISMTKLKITYVNGTSEEMLKSKSDQIIRSVK